MFVCLTEASNLSYEELTPKIILKVWNQVTRAYERYLKELEASYLNVLNCPLSQYKRKIGGKMILTQWQKTQAELSFSVLWKVELVSDDLEYVADIYYLGIKCTYLLSQNKIFCIWIQNLKHYIGKYNNLINYINWYK